MRPLRRALLAAILTTATAIGGVGLAPVAAAAPTAIEVRTWSGEVQRWATVDVCTSDGSFFDVGQTVTAQVLVGGSWADRASFTVDHEWYSCVFFGATDLVAAPGRYSVRALTRSGPSAPLLEARSTLTFVAERSSVGALDEAFYFHTTTRTKKVQASVSVGYGQRVDLQRRSGSRWVTVGGATVPRGHQSSTVDIRVPTRAGNATYRLVNRATTWSTRSVSPRFLVHQTDVAKHRRYIAAVRRHMAQFCPKTPVYVDSPDVMAPSPRAGEAHGQWSTSGASGSLRTSIHVRSGWTEPFLQDLSLHECAHVVQFRAAVEGRYEREENRAWRLWPRVGMEGQADCMAYHFHGRLEHLGYVDGCSPRQMDSARRMWRTYGHKYHPGFYRWGSSGMAAASTAPDRDARVTTVIAH